MQSSLPSPREAIDYCAMSTARIVLAEENRDTAGRMEARLRKDGHEVQTVADNRSALRAARSAAPDLLILSATAGGSTPGEIIRRLRRSPALAGVPVLLLVPLERNAETVKGLGVGEDDFLTRPVEPAVLSARVAALLRRFHPRGTEAEALQVGPIRLDAVRHEATLHGRPLQLTLTEFRLLSALASAGGRVLTRNDLIDRAIGMDALVTDRTIDVHLTSLRRKLGPARSCIKTIRGVGYRVQNET